MRLGTVPCPKCGMTGSLWIERQWIAVDPQTGNGDLHLGVVINCGCGTITNDDATVEMKPPKPATLLVEPTASGPYDPAEHTVPDVQAYAADHPDELEAILAAEYDGKARVTLIDYLEQRANEEATS